MNRKPTDRDTSADSTASEDSREISSRGLMRNAEDAAASIGGVDVEKIREHQAHTHRPQGHATEELKNSPAAQFEYGRASQHSTERAARGSDRLERGNPDVGEIDLGNIEADKPAQPDDNDLYD